MTWELLAGVVTCQRLNRTSSLDGKNILGRGGRMRTLGFRSSYQPGRDKIGKTDILENKVWLEQLHSECELLRLNFRHLCLGHKRDGEWNVGYPFSPSTHLHLVEGCFRPCMGGTLKTT